MEKKLLLSATLEEFTEAMAHAFGLYTREDVEEERVTPVVKKHYVFGYAGLCKLLGCSRATAARIKKSGVLDPAISQRGKIIVIDADMALALLSVKNKVKHLI